MKYLFIILTFLFSISTQVFSQQMFGDLVDSLICVKKEIPLSDSLSYVTYNDVVGQDCFLINETDSFQTSLLLYKPLSQLKCEKLSLPIFLFEDKINDRTFLFYYFCNYSLCLKNQNIYFDFTKCTFLEIRKIKELYNKTDSVLYELPVHTIFGRGEELAKNSYKESKFINEICINNETILFNEKYFLYNMTYEEFLSLHFLLQEEQKETSIDRVEKKGCSRNH